MSRYEFLLFLHVTAVIVWLGAGTTLTLLALYAERQRDRELAPRLGALAAWLGPRVFAPASLGTLAVGILLVLDGSWTFQPLWIRLGFVAFAVSFLLNVGVRFPLLRRLERGTLEPLRAARLLGLLARVELAVLYLAVADMLSKPTGADTGTLAGGGAILGLATLAATVGAMRARTGRLT
jgi:uncharacterized membrane protein